MENIDQESEEGSSKHYKVRFDEDKNQTRTLSCPGSSASSSSLSDTSESDASDRNSDHATMQPSSEFEGPLSTGTRTRSPLFSPTSLSNPSSPRVAGLPAGYDPNRIPLSVFANKPSNQAEWSVASNESLFSIHMGNNSFSRDHAFLLYKSGELTKLDEVFSVPTPLPPVSESTSLQRDSISSSVAMETPKLSQLEDSHGNFSGSEPLKGTASPVLGKSENDQHKGNSPPSEHVRSSRSLSARSDGSTTTASTGSFAFPILVGSERKSSSVKADVKKKDESKEAPPQPQQQQNHRTTAKAVLTNCFSCFFCCSFRCALSLK